MSAPTARPFRSTTVLAVALWLIAAQSGTATQRAGTDSRTALVRAHMEMLASDAMRGRGSGTHDELVAATYIAAELRRLGLTPLGDDGGFIQQVETPRAEFLSPPTLATSDATYTHGRQILVQTVGETHIQGPLVRFDGGEVPAGAIVLVTERQVSEPGLVSAAAAVLMQETPQIRSRWQVLANSTRATQARGRPWQVALDPTALAGISMLPAGTLIKLDADVRPGRTWNVIGQINGRDAALEEVVLLSAHLDHLGVRGAGEDTIFNGADDDASGVTAVLALASSLAADRAPRRSVMVAFFGSEEAGGYGATHFLDHPPLPLGRIVVNLEFEMIGRPDSAVPPGTLWLTGYERTTLGPALASRGAKIVADPHPSQGFFMRSDNIRLAYRGIVAQTVSSYGLHPEYHTAADDLAHIDFTHLTSSIESLLEPVRWLANSSFKPEWREGMRPAPRPVGPQ